MRVFGARPGSMDWDAPKMDTYVKSLGYTEPKHVFSTYNPEQLYYGINTEIAKINRYPIKKMSLTLPNVWSSRFLSISWLVASKNSSDKHTDHIFS